MRKIDIIIDNLREEIKKHSKEEYFKLGVIDQINGIDILELGSKKVSGGGLMFAITEDTEVQDIITPSHIFIRRLGSLFNKIERVESVLAREFPDREFNIVPSLDYNENLIDIEEFDGGVTKIDIEAKVITGDEDVVRAIKGCGFLWVV